MRAWILAMLGACGAPATPPEPLGNARGPTQDCEDEPLGPAMAPNLMEYVLSPSDLARRIVYRHRGAFLSCYAERAKHDPSLYGRVEVRFRIEPETGRATKIVTRGFDAAIDLCICEQLQQLSFDRLTGEVTVPFTFSPPR